MLKKKPHSVSRRREFFALIITLTAAALTGIPYLTSPPASQALSSGIVISQLYANGGSSGSLYRNDFIELFNRGNTPIDVAGWSVQYAVGNGAQSSTWNVTALCATSCIIQPHTYFLVQGASSGANGALLPTPDATGTFDLSSNNGKVALVNTTTSLTGSTGCPFPASVVDFVGYGNSANCSEGDADAPNPGNNDQSICRLVNGFTETDNNTNDFTLCTPNPRNSSNPPALARFNKSNATGYENGNVLLEWQTGYEVDNLGFNIYRDSGGKRTRINSQLIAGSALTVGPVALVAGRSYSFWDKVSSTNDVVYWIEDVSLNGRSTWHDPIPVVRSSLRRNPSSPGQRRSVLIDSLGRTQNPTLPARTSAGLTMPTAAQLELQSMRSTRAAVKIVIRNEGWYRITQPELVAAGFDPKTDPQYLQLFVDGKEVSISVVTERNGTFGSNSAIEFYGTEIDSQSTDKHIYWLVAGTESGLRIQRARSKGSRASSASFPYTVERKDRTIYFSGLRNGEKENFFGPVISGATLDQALVIRNLDKTSSEQAELEVSVQGVTETAHRVRVVLNDATVGEIVFNGQEAGVAKFSVRHSLIKEGENRVGLTSLAGDRDISLVDRVALTYSHSYTADDDALRFTARGKRRITVDGFSNSRIRVLDITDPNYVQELTTSVERSSDYSVTFSSGKQQRTFVAFAANRTSTPVELIAVSPSHLRDSHNGADFIIITKRELAAAIEPFKLLREQQGFKVAVVSVEDIYDEFSFGHQTPGAVRDFLEYARSNWEPSPHHVLLVGDASYDPKNYLDKGDFDLVPTKLVDTRLMETASDDWFTDFDDDGAADIPLGRLPVRTTQELTSMIGKIAAYDDLSNAEGVLLVSDSPVGYDFSAANAALKLLVPAGVRVEEVDRGKLGDANAKAQLLEGINRGSRIINYYGHGSIDLWSGDILNATDAGKVTNGDSLSFFVAMTCLNGYFQDPELDSLAEALIKSERGGAIAVWASSGMTTTDKMELMAQQMFRLIFSDGTSLTLGEATSRAKAATGDMDVRRSWILFGDPTMKLR